MKKARLTKEDPEFLHSLLEAERELNNRMVEELDKTKRELSKAQRELSVAMAQNGAKTENVAMLLTELEYVKSGKPVCFVHDTALGQISECGSEFFGSGTKKSEQVTCPECKAKMIIAPSVPPTPDSIPSNPA